MQKEPSTNTTVTSTSYRDATGKIPHNMMNDYMFRAILQKNQNVLKGLISSVLHIPPEEITDIVIKNPILLGTSIKDKGFILDLHVCINHSRIINLEMQVINEKDWSERSLSYLCDLFRQLTRGEKYRHAKSVIHIGFLDFQPFPDNIEFYSLYKLLNVKNNHLYSDKFALGVIDLTHIELATQEDKAYQIDHWARLFKSTTWEEIKMIAENNKYMEEALQALYECNADDVIREQCLARVEQLAKENYYLRTIEEQAAELAQKEATLTEMQTELEQKDTSIAEMQTELEQKDTSIAVIQAELEQLRAQLELLNVQQ